MIPAAATASQDTAPPGYSAGKAGHLARLARTGGQGHGPARMAGDDRYCTGVLTQISAITRALQEVVLGLLDDHVRHCLPGAARSGPLQADLKLRGLASTFRRMLRP